MDLGVTKKVRPLIEAVREMVNDEIVPLEAEFGSEELRTGTENVDILLHSDAGAHKNVNMLCPKAVGSCHGYEINDP